MEGAATLIVPVESQVRELDAKVLFSCAAVERGFPVILGSRAFVHFAMPFLPRGVYVAKSLRSLSDKMFRIARKLGNEIVAWDEESLVRFPAPDYYSWRLSAGTFRHLSHLFAWGPDDAEMFRRFPGYGGTPIHVTGNPRIDLLRKDVRGYFDEEAEALRRRLGGFLLVNTNFSFVNAFVASLNLVQPPRAPGQEPEVGPKARGMSPRFAQEMSRHKRAIFEGFRKLVPALCDAFPDRAVVVRPHPSERHETWRELARGRANLHVEAGGHVAPWLMASKVLIHNGCTTAVEAAVLGTPAVAWQPVTSAEYDAPLPNALSHPAFDAASVRRCVAAILEGRLGAVGGAERARILDRHLCATDGRLATDRVLDVLEQAGYAKGAPPWPGLAEYLEGFARGNVRTVRKLMKRWRTEHWNSAAYHEHRFPALATSDLEQRIVRFRKQLGRFDGVRARALARHIFRIEPGG